MINNFKIEDTKVKWSEDDLLSDRIVIKSVPFSYSFNFLSEKQLIEALTKIKIGNKEKHFVFIDNTVSSLYGTRIFKNHELFPLTVKETNKTLPVATKLLNKLQENNFTKKEVLLSAGGGITQDVSSFARAVFKRGIPWTYVPTTLLAMGDSCIGAKACLNYNNVKNLLGLFSAPREILIHTGFLKTLSEREILSGYGEIIKLAIVGGPSAIEKFKVISRFQNGNRLKNIDQMIRLSLIIKKSVVELDEFEHNIRKALNYGHTVGHAIEPLVSYKIPHGIAISLGMMIENLIAAEAGFLSHQEAEILNDMISPLVDEKSWNLLKGVSTKEIIGNMMRDKKTMDKDIYMSVPRKIGQFDMLKVSSDKFFETRLSAIFAKISDRRIA